MRLASLIGGFAALTVVAICSASTIPSSTFDSDEVVNLQVQRTIIANSPILREEHTIVIGLKEKMSGPVNNYIFVMPPSVSLKLAQLSAFSEGGGAQLEVNEIVTTSDLFPIGTRLFSINLPRSLDKENRKVTIGVMATFVDRWSAWPSVAPQHSPLSIKAEMAPYFYTPYHTVSQKTGLILIKEFELNAMDCPEPRNLKPIKVPNSSGLNGANQYVCGVYENIAPLSDSMGSMWASVKAMQVPFLKINKLDRSVELNTLMSRIFVTEGYEFEHLGHHAKDDTFLKFSFLKSFRERNTKVQTIPIISIIIPSEAQELQVRDEVGVIHTSFQRRPSPANKNSQVVDIQPRFPLHGGWSCHWQVTYQLPLKAYTTHSPINQSSMARVWRLMLPLFEIYNDVAIGEFSLRLIVPGGVKTFDRFPIITGIDSLIKARDTRVISAALHLGSKHEYKITLKNMVKEHQVFMAVHFDYSWWSSFRQPISIIVVVLVVIFSLGSLGKLEGVMDLGGEDVEKSIANIAYLIRDRRFIIKDLNIDALVEKGEGDDSSDSIEKKKETNESTRKDRESSRVAELYELSNKITLSVLPTDAGRVALQAQSALAKLYEEQVLKLGSHLNEKSLPTKAKLEKEVTSLDHKISQCEAKLLSSLSSLL